MIAGQRVQQLIVALDQCLFLCAAPTLEPALSRDCIRQILKLLMPRENGGTSRCCVSAKAAGIMLTHSVPEIPARDADIIGSIGTAENIDVDVAQSCVLRLTTRRVVAQDEVDFFSRHIFSYLEPPAVRRRTHVKSPRSGILHRCPGLGAWFGLALLEELDRDVVGRAEAGHAAVSGRAVDGDAGFYELVAGGVD